MNRQVSAALIVSIVLLSACENMETRPGETLGTLIGAGLGAVVGSRIGDGAGQSVATAMGALAGAWAGGRLGKKLDENDRLQAEQTAQESLESNPVGVSSTWKNPDSGNSGTITPGNTFQTAEGEDCRLFESTVTVEGKTEATQGRACRQADGSWLVVQ